MKIERISESTVKLTLSHTDFEKRSINVDQLCVDSPTYQKLLWDALEHAEIELGVHISAGKIRVEEAVESGNYEITITNIPGVSDSNEEQNTAASEKKAEGRSIQPLRPVAAIPAHVLAQMVRSGMLPPSLMKGVAVPLENGNSGTAENLSEENGTQIIRIAPEPVAFPDAEGNGVIYFRDYNEMYGFFKHNPSFAGLPSALYMLEDAFYLVVHDSGKRGALMARLEVRLADYNATLLPADVFIPMLKEYGTVMFKKAAIKKVMTSLDT